MQFIRMVMDVCICIYLFLRLRIFYFKIKQAKRNNNNKVFRLISDFCQKLLSKEKCRHAFNSLEATKIWALQPAFQL